MQDKWDRARETESAKSVTRRGGNGRKHEKNLQKRRKGTKKDSREKSLAIPREIASN